MTESVTLAALAWLDLAICGFRAAAGRDGRIDKRDYYLRAVARTALLGLGAVAAHAALAAILVGTAPDPAATWAAGVAAARAMLDIYLVYAVLVLAAIALFVLPIGDFRILTTVIVLGPMTLIRRLVILGGVAAAILRTSDARVVAVLVLAGATMLTFEGIIGRRYAARWALLRVPLRRAPDGESG